MKSLRKKMAPFEQQQNAYELHELLSCAFARSDQDDSHDAFYEVQCNPLAAIKTKNKREEKTESVNVDRPMKN